MLTPWKELHELLFEELSGDSLIMPEEFVDIVMSKVLRNQQNYPIEIANVAKYINKLRCAGSNKNQLKIKDLKNLVAQLWNNKCQSSNEVTINFFNEHKKFFSNKNFFQKCKACFFFCCIDNDTENFFENHIIFEKTPLINSKIIGMSDQNGQSSIMNDYKLDYQDIRRYYSDELIKLLQARINELQCFPAKKSYFDDIMLHIQNFDRFEEGLIKSFVEMNNDYYFPNGSRAGATIKRFLKRFRAPYESACSAYKKQQEREDTAQLKVKKKFTV